VFFFLVPNIDKIPKNKFQIPTEYKFTFELEFINDNTFSKTVGYR